MPRVIFFAVTAVGIFLSAPSFAQSPDDVRCLMLSNVFAKASSAGGNDHAEAQRAAQSAALFFLGKIDGRWSEEQLRAARTQQQKTITSANAGAGMQRCMQRMQASAKKMQAIRP